MTEAELTRIAEMWDQLDPDDAQLLASLSAVQVFSKDILKASRTLREDEVRFLVSAYNLWQKARIQQANQARSYAVNGEPNAILKYQFDETVLLETRARAALGEYANSQVEGKWMRSICGVGPVIAAGIMAHTHAPHMNTVGKLWHFAGYDPTAVWEKGQKRPHNAQLKRLCFLVGESFVKVQNRDADVYGQIYKNRKEYEKAKNEAGDYADQAAAALEKKKYGDDTIAKGKYLQGKLPDARIHMRCMRYAVKMFLSHYHTVWWAVHEQKLPPFPYAISRLGHADYIPPPNIQLVPGLDRLLLDSDLVQKYQVEGIQDQLVPLDEAEEVAV